MNTQLAGLAQCKDISPVPLHNVGSIRMNLFQQLPFIVFWKASLLLIGELLKGSRDLMHIGLGLWWPYFLGPQKANFDRILENTNNSEKYKAGILKQSGV